MPILLKNKMALTHMGTDMHFYHDPFGFCDDGYRTGGYLPDKTWILNIHYYFQIRLDDDGYAHEKVNDRTKKKQGV
jgi:hypothetical protein